MVAWKGSRAVPLVIFGTLTAFALSTLADEPAILAETVKLVQSLTDVPLSIDSSIVEALEARSDAAEAIASCC